MTRDAWYRNTTWNDAIAEAFSAKLRRARRKSQYLRIQAGYLKTTYPDVALSLLDQYFALGNDFDLAQAHVDRAGALQAKGDLLGSIRSLELALERETEFPNLQTMASSDLPLLIAKQRVKDRYAQALTLLDSQSVPAMFPVETFRLAAARAMILDDLGRLDQARDSARVALEAARQTSSVFRYHPTVGLVSDAYAEVLARVTAISGV